MSLQDGAATTEDQIASVRQDYNDDVMKYDTKIQSFPSNMMASTFGFNAREQPVLM